MSDKEKKAKHIYRPCGTYGKIVYESIFYEGKPAFLVLTRDGLKVVPELNIKAEGLIIHPLERHGFPYNPYSLDSEGLEFLKTWTPDPAFLYKLVYGEYNAFLDLEAEYKVLETAQTLETYQQHKLMTTSYPYHFGGNDSGKTRALEVHRELDYRPLLSPSLPSADVYTYLGYHEEGCGTILEDEAERLNKPRYEEKLKIYRAGYRKGAMVPRIEFPKRGARIQRFYKAFCCKCFAGLWIPNDRGFAQRCIPIPMVEGDPEKDEFTKDDFPRFNKTRLGLLVWRMKTYFDPLPPIDTKLSGRIKELWKPKLQVGWLLPSRKIIEDLAIKEMRRKDEERRSRLEAYIARAVIKVYVGLEGHEMPFSSIWNQLILELGLDDKAEEDGSLNTSMFGKVTKTTVGLKLGSIFGGERHHRGKVGRTYTFQRDRLVKLARRYRLKEEFVNGLKGLNGSKGVKTLLPRGEETPIPPKNRLNRLDRLKETPP